MSFSSEKVLPKSHKFFFCNFKLFITKVKFKKMGDHFLNACSMHQYRYFLKTGCFVDTSIPKCLLINRGATLSLEKIISNSIFVISTKKDHKNQIINNTKKIN